MKYSLDINKLKQKREEKGWSASQLAQEAGVSTKTVYRWENDGAQPRFEQLSILAKTLDCQPQDLLESDDTQISFYVDNKLAKAITLRAAKNDHSFKDEIVATLERSIEGQDSSMVNMVNMAVMRTYIGEERANAILRQIADYIRLHELESGVKQEERPIIGLNT
jgi:transcriptional regulator with XRE-family HTH domain